MTFNATEIKKKGIVWVGKIVDKYGAMLVTVRGKVKYVVMTIDEYDRLKNIELEKIKSETK